MTFRLASKIAAVAMAGASLAACQSMPAPSVARTALAGTPLLLGHWASLNPDCTSIGDVVLRIVKEPGHGRVAIALGNGYTFFLKDNVRNACNYKPSPGTNATYVAAPGYAGPDSVTLTGIFPDGAETQRTFEINVK